MCRILTGKKLGWVCRDPVREILAVIESFRPNILIQNLKITTWKRFLLWHLSSLAHAKWRIASSALVQICPRWAGRGNWVLARVGQGGGLKPKLEHGGMSEPSEKGKSEKVGKDMIGMQWTPTIIIQWAAFSSLLRQGEVLPRFFLDTSIRFSSSPCQLFIFVNFSLRQGFTWPLLY